MPTRRRIDKVNKVLSLRQPDLRVVLEEVTNTHNASAVVRTCDAAGILDVDIITASLNPFPINEAISTRAEKWLQFHYHLTTTECLLHLKEKGFKIAATHLGKNSIPYDAVDYTQPIAVVFGNESEGISEEALRMADYAVQIPMVGMVQSLNLSVSAGIILYEAVRQRHQKGYCSQRRLLQDELESIRKKWLRLNPRR